MKIKILLVIISFFLGFIFGRLDIFEKFEIPKKNCYWKNISGEFQEVPLSDMADHFYSGGKIDNVDRNKFELRCDQRFNKL